MQVRQSVRPSTSQPIKPIVVHQSYYINLIKVVQFFFFIDLFRFVIIFLFYFALFPPPHRHRINKSNQMFESMVSECKRDYVRRLSDDLFRVSVVRKAKASFSGNCFWYRIFLDGAHHERKSHISNVRGLGTACYVYSLYHVSWCHVTSCHMSYWFESRAKCALHYHRSTSTVFPGGVVGIIMSD